MDTLDSGQATAPTVGAVEPPPPSPPRPRRLGRLIAVSVAGVLVLGIAGTALGLVIATGNDKPEAPVLAYLQAQAAGNVADMWANAVFDHGDGGLDRFFTQDALRAMMAQPANRELTKITLISSHTNDDGSASVVIGYWARNRHIERSFDVRSIRKDVVVLPVWRAVIPAETVSIIPASPQGTLTVDGIDVPISVGSQLKVIPGVHHVAMAATSLLAAQTATTDQPVDFGSGSSTLRVVLSAALNDNAKNVARMAVDRLFTSSDACDPVQHNLCLNHLYKAPTDGYTYFLNFPDHPRTTYSNYVLTVVGDPLATLQLDMTSEPGSLSFSGACTIKVVVDGGRSWQHDGSYSGTLAWQASPSASYFSVLTFDHTC